MFGQQVSASYLIYVCVISFIILVVISYYYWTLPDIIMVKMGNYIQLITVFILTITGIITIMTFKYQMDDRSRALSLQYANLTQNEVNDVDKQFMNNPLLDRLYFQMYSDIPHVQKIKSMTGPIMESPDMLKAEHHMSGIIFQKIADVYFCERLDNNTDNDCIEWINTFKSWMKSPILKSNWEQLKHEYHPDVQYFIDHVLI